MTESPQPENNILPPWGCNICFEESREPVCTTCGHLFCWPCLYTWVHDMRKQACPVCRAPLSVDDNVIPVYVAPRAEPSQGAATPPSTTPARPHPARRRPAPSARAQSIITSAETQPVPRDNLNRRHVYGERRERLSRVQREQAEERAWLASEEAANEQFESLVEADNRSFSQLRRELMRRRNASSNRQMDRPRNAGSARRGMSAIMGRLTRRFGSAHIN